MDLKRHEDDFPQANSQNAMGTWLSKDGHLHGTLTAFITVVIRLGQQQGRRYIGISNIVTHHA